MSLAGGQQTIEEQIKEAIEKSVADSTAEVGGDGRHFEIQVISPVFEGKRTLEKQRWRRRVRPIRNRSRRYQGWRKTACSHWDQYKHSSRLLWKSRSPFRISS